MPRDTFSPGSDDSILIRAFGIVRRRKEIAAIAFATLFAAIAAFVLYLPDLYRASAIVVVERPLAELGARPAVAGDLERRLHVIKQEVLSRDRLTELVKRFNLYPDLRDKMSFEDILTQARNDIHWEANGPERASGASSTVTFNLTYTGSDPKTVADVTNTIADFYVAYNDQMRTDAARNAAKLLKTQVESARREMDQAQARMASFASANTAQLAQSAGVNAATYMQLSDSLRYIRAERARLDSDRRRMLELAEEAAAAAGAVAEKAGAVTGNDAVAPSKELTQLIADLQKAEDELREMTTTGNLAAGHPRVLQISERIALLTRQVEDQRAKDVAAHEQETRRAEVAGAEMPKALPRGRATIQDIDKEMARLAKEAGEIEAQMKQFAARFEGSGPVQQQYFVLQRDYEAARANYDALEREYERAAQIETVETGRQGERFRVIDAAVVPEGPAAPNRLRLLIMGLLLSLAVAALAVIGAEKLDTSFHSVDELREYTSVPVIATIPRIGAGPRRGYGRLALGAVSAVAVVVLAATLSAYIANGNEQLVRMLQRAG